MPPEAVVVLVSFNLASSFERKNPLQAIAAFRAAFGERTYMSATASRSRPGSEKARPARPRSVTMINATPKGEI